MKPSNGCIGGCCEEFPINMAANNGTGFTPDDMRKLVIKNKGTLMEKETNQIARMIIALGYRRGNDNRLVYTWTCKNFDKENRLCKIYDERPNMCSGYPDGKECHYEGCGFEEKVA